MSSDWSHCMLIRLYCLNGKFLFKINCKVDLTVCYIFCLRKAAVSFISANRFHDDKFNRCPTSMPQWHHVSFLKHKIRRCVVVSTCSFVQRLLVTFVKGINSQKIPLWRYAAMFAAISFVSESGAGPFSID